MAHEVPPFFNQTGHRKMKKIGKSTASDFRALKIPE